MTNLTQSPTVKERVWPIRALGWLFLLQTAILIGVGLYYLVYGSPSNDFQTLFTYNPTLVSSGQQIQVIYKYTLFPLGIITLVASIGFFQRWAIAWMYAMLAQGLILTTNLAQYFYAEPNYPSMLFSTFLVLYLNYADGQANLQGKSIEAEEKGLPLAEVGS